MFLRCKNGFFRNSHSKIKGNPTKSKGNCRRWIGRALNVMNRIGSINQKEMDKAFYQAKKNGPTLVGIASHDFRDIEKEVNFLRKMIRKDNLKMELIEFNPFSLKGNIVKSSIIKKEIVDGQSLLHIRSLDKGPR